MIEEFMLLANITVAKKILDHYATFALLRRHPSPSESSCETLIKSAEIMVIVLFEKISCVVFFVSFSISFKYYHYRNIFYTA